jgi:adenine-specific DNA-methyltransferase
MGPEKKRGKGLAAEARIYRQDNLTSQSVGREKGEGAASWFPVRIRGQEIRPNEKVRWKTNQEGMARLLRANRVDLTGNSLSYVRYLDDFSAFEVNNSWEDIGGIQSSIPIQLEQVAQPSREAVGPGWRRQAGSLSLADRR